MEQKFRLKTFRKETIKLTQEQMALKLNISQQLYALYEQNKRKMCDIFLVKLYEEFRLNPLWVLTGNGSQFVEGSDIYNDLTSQLTSTLYKFNFNADESVELLIKAHKVDSEFNDIIRKVIVEKILEKIYSSIKTKLPNNFKIFFLIKILNTIDKKEQIKDSYKAYLLDKVNNFKTDIFYTNSHKQSLLKVLRDLDEVACQHIIKNIDYTIKINEEGVDSLTKFTNKYILPIHKAQSIVKFFMPSAK